MGGKIQDVKTWMGSDKGQLVLVGLFTAAMYLAGLVQKHM